MYVFSLAQCSWENLIQCELKCAGDKLGFFGRDCKGRGEKNVIAAKAIHASLCGISQNVFLERCLAYCFRDIFFFGEGFARGFVFYEFDSPEETEAPDFADVWMSSEWS